MQNKKSKKNRLIDVKYHEDMSDLFHMFTVKTNTVLFIYIKMNFGLSYEQ